MVVPVKFVDGLFSWVYRRSKILHKRLGLPRKFCVW